MRDTQNERPANPPPRPQGDGTPRFGRLLIVLVLALLLIVAITFGSEAYFS
jgi:4-hydroxybenzoate polyprenyltransferase